MALIPVENHSELFRDSVTGAIVNKSKSDFERYSNTRNKMLSKEERINDLEQKVDNLSSDRRITPMLNLDHAAITFVNNRTNKPVASYEDDLRVNSVREDPDRFFYITKNVVLENPATSLEVIIEGYVPDLCDLRVFYAVNQDKKLDDVIFTPFPGHKNLNINGQIISQTKSDGQSNLKVPKVDLYVQTPSVDLFKEYSFTADDLSPFNQFRIKIVGTSTNAAVVPQLRNLRATALA